MTEFSNAFLMRLMCAVDTGLLTYRHYMPWCDAIIAEEEEPPYWMIELAIMKCRIQAVKLLSLAAYRNFQEDWCPSAYGDFWVCCQFLRYNRGEISWANFLKEAGDCADANGTRWDCGEFYLMLSQYETSQFSRPLKRSQVAHFRGPFAEVIDEVSAFCEPFRCSFCGYEEERI